jgi:hypothetical protein
MLKGSFVYFLILLVFSCKYEPSKSLKIRASHTTESRKINDVINKNQNKILGPGVLYYRGRQMVNAAASAIVNIRNVNGELYRQINVLNDTIILADFSPFMIYLEHDILVFEVKKMIAPNCWVYLNKEVKKIDLNENKILEFVTWEDYFLKKDISLELDKSNTLYNGYGDKKRRLNKKIDFEEDEFTALAIKGYWMKIRVTHFGEEEELDESFEAWINWRNQSNLLVDVGIGR